MSIYGVNTKQLFTDKDLLNQFICDFDNYLNINSGRNKELLSKEINIDLGLDFVGLGEGYTSIVVGDDNIAIKIYVNDKEEELPEICNDMILKDMEQFNFVPKFLGGIEHKFIIMERIKYEPIDFDNLPLTEFNKIFQQILEVHCSGIVANDLHIDNIVWSEDKQRYMFIDVGAFSKEGYIGIETVFEIVHKELIEDSRIPMLKCILMIPYAKDLWKQVYYPLIRKADFGTLQKENFDFSTLDVVGEEFLQFEQIMLAQIS